MADSSNRSPSPLPARHPPPARRSFSGSPSPKPFPLTNPRRSFNPITPANSPADSGRRALPVKDEISSSWDYAEKENEKATKLRSPAKGSKNFMSPTISAASKFCPSPKKKVLTDRNEPVRSSIALCNGKATFFSSEATEYAKPKEDVLQGPPLTKALKRVTFAEVPLYCDKSSDSFSEVKDPDCFDAETCSNNLNSWSTLSPSTTTTIAPLDADPSPSPYDPKTNYLSPRPQFLHYRPNSRIEVLKGIDMGEIKLLDENSDSDSQIEDSQKESEDSDSAEAKIVKAVVEETVILEEPKCSDDMVVVGKFDSFEEEIIVEQETGETEVTEEIDSADEMAKEISDVQKQRKPRFFMSPKWASLILILVIACVSISLTYSPVINDYGVKDLKLTNLSSLGSQISLNDHFKGSSDFSSLITGDLGPMKFIDFTPDLKRGSEWGLEEDREFTELEGKLEDDELENDEVKEVEEDEVEEDVDYDVEGSEGENDPGFGEISEVEFGEKIEFEEDKVEFEDVGSAEVEAFEEVYTDYSPLDNSEMESGENVVLEVEGGDNNEMEYGENVELEVEGGDNSMGNQKQELIIASVNMDELVAATQEFDTKTEVVEMVDADDNANSHTQLETTLLDANLDTKIDDPSTSEMLVSPPVIQINERSFTIHQMLLGISSAFLGAVAVAVFLFLKQKSVTPTEPCLPKKQSFKDSEPEADVVAESCSSEMSTSYSRNYGMQQTSRAQRQDRKSNKSTTRRDSVAASSDYSLGSPSPSYGSFTTYERIPNKHHGSGGGEEIITPVRRSSRIRSQVTSP